MVSNNHIKTFIFNQCKHKSSTQFNLRPSTRRANSEQPCATMKSSSHNTRTNCRQSWYYLYLSYIIWSQYRLLAFKLTLLGIQSRMISRPDMFTFIGTNLFHLVHSMHKYQTNAVFIIYLKHD